VKKELLKASSHLSSRQLVLKPQNSQETLLMSEELKPTPNTAKTMLEAYSSSTLKLCAPMSEF
jgi:Tfp pilus assembly protein PilP